MYAQIKTEGTYTPDALFAGETDDVVTKKIVVLGGGGVLPRGAVLGKITANGKLVLSASAANDGSEVPYAILADDDVDASGADVEVMAYFNGPFNAAALTFGTGHTAASTFDALRDKGIFLV
nr:head decoration protein [uncultured Pseudogulbenkiania sp.]